MAFGQELRDFTSAFSAGYNAASDARDKKWQRERDKLNDPIDRDYKSAITEHTKLTNKWYEQIAADAHADNASVRRARDINSEWAPELNQSAIDARRASMYGDAFGRRTGKPGETLGGEAPGGGPAISDDPTSGDPYSGGTESADPGVDAAPTSDTGDGDQSSLQNTWLKYANTDAIRNQPLSPKLTNALSFLPDMGVQMVVFSGGQPSSGPNRTGSHRHDNGLAGDVLFVKDGKQLDWANPQDRPIFQQIVARAEQNGVTGFGAGPGYMKEGSMHVGYGKPAVWGAGGSGRNAPDWLRQASLGYSRGGMVRSAIPVEVHAARGGAIPALDEPDQPGVPDEQEQRPSGVVRIQMADAGPTQAAAPAPQQALPAEGPIPEERPAGPDVTSGGNKPDVGYDPAVADDPKVIGFTKAHEAVLDGMTYALQQAGLDHGTAVQDPERAKKMAEYLKGAGAAPKAVIDQAYEKIDSLHKEKLPESERTMAALGMVYDHYIKRGEPDKAKAAAASIVQYQRKLFQQYSAITKAAIAAGDMDGATKSAIRAYSSVPDGQEATVKKMKDGRYQVEIKDEATGKVTSKPIYTPQEIGAWAMQVNPGSFDQFIMDAAGQRKKLSTVPSDEFQSLVTGIDSGKIPTNEDMAKLPMAEQKEIRQRVNDYAAAAKAKAAADPNSPEYAKAPTRAEIDKARESVTADWEALSGETDENDQPVHALKGLTDTDTKAITDAATNILASPKNVTADYSISPRDANEAAFTVAQSNDYTVADDKGGKKIQLPDGRDVWMPIQRFTALKSIYQRNVAEAKKTQKDKTGADEDSRYNSEQRARTDKKNREENPGLLGDQSIPSSTMGGIGQTQSTLDALKKLMGQ